MIITDFARKPAPSTPQPTRYDPSWVDRLNHWIEQLPGSPLLFYVALGLVLSVLHAAIKWWDSSYPPGTFQPFHVVVMCFGVWFMGLAHYLNRAAKRAFERFRPVLDCNKYCCNELEYRLTTLPARPTLLVTALGLAYGIFVVVGVAQGTVFDPAALVFTSPLAVWFESASGIFVCTAFCLLVYHTIHQARMINLIYTTSTRIDLFNLTPIHAFSVLTAQTAAGGLPIAYAWILTEPGIAGDSFSVAAVAILMIVALITFLWPLLGIHRLLEEEKSLAKVKAARRIKQCIDRLHEHVDKDKLAEAPNPINAIAGLKQELAFLEQISTWPWQPNPLPALARALVLPLVLWFVTRLLERLITF
ncbi:MAG TPA: hypothetical protein PKE45_17660 [Caldilineaceae bacterium]|nr:hypothetical protein [Caldilineaceae bacterium]